MHSDLGWGDNDCVDIIYLYITDNRLYSPHINS